MKKAVTKGACYTLSIPSLTNIKIDGQISGGRVHGVEVVENMAAEHAVEAVGSISVDERYKVSRALVDMEAHERLIVIFMQNQMET